MTGNAPAWRLAAMALAPFRHAGHLHVPLLSIFVAINAIVAINVVIHDSQIGYDAIEHHRYLHALARGVMPTAEDSLEYYSAPLPYALGASFRLVGVTRTGVLGKLTQLMNLGASLLITFAVIRICRRMREHPSVALWALVLLGMLPVYHRTLGFVRGEGLCAALGLLACDRVLATRGREPLSVGLLLGLALLAKQWAVFIVAAVLLHVLIETWRSAGWRRAARTVVTIAVLTMVVSGWFYAYLGVRFGSPILSARDHPPFSLFLRPAEFYTRLDIAKTFTDPVRDTTSEDAQALLPMMYADTWGDFWSYWLAAWDSERRAVISPRTYLYPAPALEEAPLRPYLRWLMFAGILPSLLVGFGVLSGVGVLLRRRCADTATRGVALVTLAAGCTIIGYITLTSWITHIDPKATYLFQCFPYLAVLGAAYLYRLEDWSPRSAVAIKTGLIFILLHNLPALFSQYSFLGGIHRWR